MDINKVFVSGKMEKNLDERHITNGDYRDATNIRVLTSVDSDSGAVENVQGNEILTSLGLTNALTKGGIANNENEKVYWFVSADEKDLIVEYDKNTDTTTIILQHTTLLNFSPILGINLFDDLIFWTDGVNAPRMVNIERAKAFGLDGFTEVDISVIKAPPLYPPTIVLQTTESNEENNLDEKFLAFAYRYKYLDGQWSAMSPFSPYAFLPKPFTFDFATSSNDSMTNLANQVEISFNTGGRTIEEIELVFKQSGHNNINIIDSFNKVRLNYSDNTVQTFLFDNSKIYIVLPEQETLRLFDNVPLLANAQESLGNRVIYGDYTEQRNIEDCSQNPIEIDYSLELNSTPVADLIPVPSLKSNRDYELAINYLDDNGRITTCLVSKENTIYIPNGNSIDQNKIIVNLFNPPPCWATKYRFFIKQSKKDYETLIPTVFYIEQNFLWIQLELSEINKVKEDTVLIIKADTIGLKSEIVISKVLEVKYQEENFLDTTVIDETLQIAGWYYKIREKDFTFDTDTYEVYNWESYDHPSPDYGNPVRNDANTIIEPPIFYGGGLNDPLSSGLFTGITDDFRYLVEIFTIGTPDTYRWSKDNGQTWDDNGGLGYDCTVAPQAIELGVLVEFPNTTGHTLGDYWVIGAKTAELEQATSGTEEDDWAFSLFKNIPTEQIFSGSVITITYHEYGSFETIFIKKSFTSSTDYANLEEWYFGDDIGSKLSPLDPDFIWFRKGNVFNDPDGNQQAKYIDLDQNGTMTMIVRSVNTRLVIATPHANVTLDILQSGTLPVIETQPLDLDTGIYDEIGETYDIIGGIHQGQTQNQVLTPQLSGSLVIGKKYRIETYIAGDDFNNVGALNESGDIFVAIGTTPTVWTNSSSLVQPTVSELEIFNCFSYGNVVESYKIRDAFNGVSMFMDTRPSAVDDSYHQHRNIASLIYSGLFNKNIKLNNLNEFNLALFPKKNLDEKWGAIGILFNDRGNLLIIQEDATSQILYNKKALFDATGSSTVTTSQEILGSQQYYSGLYGISKDVRTFAVKGRRKYWVDSKRGAVLRLSNDGVTEISAVGMLDWFKDKLRDNTYSEKLGVFEPFHEEYIVYIKTSGGYYTLAFNEIPKGWTSFYTFEPEFMLAMNNEFYSFKQGELYKHNSNIVPRQQFYGIDNDFDITVIINDAALSDKIFKTLSTESNAPFNASIITNYTNTELIKADFEKKESFYYADLWQSENDADLTGFNANGLGVIQAVTSNIITLFNKVGFSTSLTDKLMMQYDVGDIREIGVIIDINSTVITVDTVINIPEAGKYVFSKKNARIEGSEIRGYYAEIKLYNDDNVPVELNGITSNSVLSNV